jgi:flagellar basal body rod protein FlgG
MLYGLYLSAMGMQAQEKRLDVTANNLANANTTGFKRDLAVEQARASAPFEDVRMGQYRMHMLAKQGGGVRLQGGGVDLTQAMLQQTGKETDLALDGKGFFVVKGADGQTTLTRDGRLSLNADGTLVAATSGRPVLNAEGQAIRLNPALPIIVHNDGTISQTGGDQVKLKLMDVTDGRQVVKLGANLMTVADEKALKAIDPSTIVRQGSLEQSGVDPIVEMVSMMEGQRVFDANAKMISYQDQTLQQANSIGKVA